jgi:TrkA domain protein
MNAEIEEQELPGIGRRYRLAGRDGGAAVVIVHHSGRRDLYVMAPETEVPQATLALTDRQARTLGAVLSGAYFTPAVVDEMDAVIGDILIDWVTLRPDSQGADRSIAELEIGRRTRMTVVAVARDAGTIIAPEPTEVLRAGDRLVVVGRPEDLAAFTRHVSLILATLARAAGLDERVGPFIAGYVLLLAFAGPLLASRSTTLARWIPARLVGETV